MKRILVTGSRTWTNQSLVYYYLKNLNADSVILVHGGAVGLDTIAGEIWESMGGTCEVHLASDFATPLLRNIHMVELGADLCIAFAQSWKSGTGHCARYARANRIPVIDAGVSTK